MNILAVLNYGQPQTFYHGVLSYFCPWKLELASYWPILSQLIYKTWYYFLLYQ